MQVTGTKGAVFVGPHEAASFASWSLQPGEEPGTFVFMGLTRTVNAFWITQAPHELRVTVGSSTWRWRGVLLTVAEGGRVHASVPRPEIR